MSIEPSESTSDSSERPGGQLTRRAVVVRGAAALGAISAGAFLGGTASAASKRPLRFGATSKTRFSGLNIGIVAPPASLDPHKTTANELCAFQEMFEPLINRMPDRTLVPALAQGPLERLDARTWRATLREDRTFTDGSPITAEDVKFSWDRVLDPKFASPYAGYVSIIKSVTIIDKKTIEFKTTGNIDIVPDRVAIVRVVPMAVVKQKGDKVFATDPGVGSGSMFNSKPISSAGIYLQAYDKYNGVFPVYTDEAAYLYVADDATKVAQLKANQIQIAQAVGQLNFKAVQRDKHIKLGITPLAASTMIGTAMLNCGKKPFNDKRVRQAFMYSLDRDQLVKIGALGQAKVADSPLPAAHKFHVRPSIFYNHDPEKSKFLLKQAGYDGVSFELTVSNVPPVSSYGPLMQQQLKRGGFNARVRTREIDAAFPDIFAGKYDAVVFPHQFEVFSYDTDMLLRGWWGGFFNEKAAFWTTPGAKRLPKLLDAALVAGSDDRKRELYGQVQQIIVEEAASSPLIFQPSVTAWRNELKGFKAPWTFIQAIYNVKPAA